jgi:hypothetical protein
MHCGTRILLLPGFSILTALWLLAAQCQMPVASAVPEPGEIFRDCPDCAGVVVVLR